MEIGITSASRRRSLDSKDSTEIIQGLNSLITERLGLFFITPVPVRVCMYFFDGLCLAVKLHEVRRNAA